VRVGSSVSLGDRRCAPPKTLQNPCSQITSKALNDKRTYLSSPQALKTSHSALLFLDYIPRARAPGNELGT